MDFLPVVRDQVVCSSHRRRRNRIVRGLATVCMAVSVCLWLLAPLVFRASPSIQRFFIFLNTVDDGVDLSRPEDLGLPGTRTFHLTTGHGITVGLWHILPESLVHSAPEEKPAERDAWFEASLADFRPIVLYLHGNKGSRGQPHRVDMYAMLRRQDYHVVTFDYRGYGDSSHVIPSEAGLVADTKAIFAYLRERSGRSPVIMWGHSLGTGVSCHAASDLCRDLKCPHALVLEAPFSNIQDEVRLNPLSQAFYYIPYFDWAFVEPMKSIDAEFRSDTHIKNVDCPILMLHAQDDHVVPIQLARKLEKAGREGRSPAAGPIKFVEFDASLGLGHSSIHQAPQLPAIVREFVRKVT